MFILHFCSARIQDCFSKTEQGLYLETVFRKARHDLKTKTIGSKDRELDKNNRFQRQITRHQNPFSLSKTETESWDHATLIQKADLFWCVRLWYLQNAVRPLDGDLCLWMAPYVSLYLCMASYRDLAQPQPSQNSFLNKTFFFFDNSVRIMLWKHNGNFKACLPVRANVSKVLLGSTKAVN